jgi:lysyl-tRNA synthetase class 2
MEEQFNIRLEKLQKLRDLGVAAYPYAFDRSHSFAQILEEYGRRDHDELEQNDEVCSLAGRIVAIRKMGKSSFLHLFDGEDRLQVYIRRDVLSEEDYAVFELLDIGDIIGAGGTIFRTRSGELTLLVKNLTFLAKSFHPLPEKWHGLQDKELRFRQRYLDLIVNESSRRNFKLRSLIIQAIRMFFYDKGYREVETPMMQPIPGGASARPFVTHHNALDIDLYLRIAPELYLKRLLVGGMEKVFEINRNFRNEGISLMHNPEFTMIEFYELYQDFNHYMELTEELLKELNERFLEGGEIDWGGEKISMTPPFRRESYMELLSKKTGLSISDLWDESRVGDFIEKKLPEEERPPTFGKMLELLFDTHVEASLRAPTFVTHYPKVISPLSKVSREDERETERFELYVAGMEIANGFSELNDPLDQRKRFENQLLDREKGDDEAQWLDNDFLRALEYGMPPAAGEGIGIDRLVMLYTGAASIKEVVLFPLLRPKE